jgi:hypothetical protein
MHPLVSNRLMHQPIECYTLISETGPDKDYCSIPLTINGYLVGKSTVVVNKAGQQVTSSQQLFVKAEDFVRVKEGDLMKLNPQSNIQFPIIAVQPFYKAFGILSYGVCYFS